jgi:hypothetical protein
MRFIMQNSNNAQQQHQENWNAPQFHPPLYSPDKQYIWDGQTWIHNPSNSGGSGFLAGLILGMAIVYLYFTFG